jgi:DNA-binding Xre family transcriptional regulator
LQIEKAMLYKEETFVGTVIAMPKKTAAESQPPIQFNIDDAIDRYNATRPKGEHLTLYKIEKLTGIHNTTTWRHRRGDSRGIEWETLAKYCEILDCTPGDLLRYTRGSVKLEVKKLK